MIKYTIDISFLQVHEIMFLRLRVTGQASVTREFDSCLTLKFFKALVMLIFFVKFRIFSFVPLRVVV